MRVISGKLKGRVLTGYHIEGTRPTMDRVKESVFASIQNRLEGSVVLDLFAGSGNLGIEAISNGASRCYFVDNNRECIKVISNNIKNFGIESECTILQSDYHKALENFKNQQILFDIIFIDPPYRYQIKKELLELIRKYQILADDGIIVFEYQKDNDINTIEEFGLVQTKKYGDKYVSIYRILEN